MRMSRNKEKNHHLTHLGISYFFLYTFVPSIMLVVIILFTVYQAQLNFNKEKILVEDRYRINSFSETVTNYLNSAVTDMLLLSNLEEVKKFLKDTDKEELSGLTKELFAFCKLKPFCSQVRVIDNSGMELVKIKKGDNRTILLPVDALKNKKDRYYFKEIITLNEGGVYVSPLDLNIEYGAIEVPWRPVIRIGVPVFGDDKERDGLVILNISGEALLSRLTQLSHTSEVIPMILNPEGYWLSGNRRENRFGFMFKDKKEVRFGNRHTAVWSRISRESAGQLDGFNEIMADKASIKQIPEKGVIESGIYSFTTLYRTDKGFTHGEFNGTLSSGDVLHGESRIEPYWKIVFFTSNQQIISALFIKYLTVFAALVILLFFMYLYYARYRINLKESEESIRHMAYYDVLTGLPNRLLFVDRLNQLLQREAWRNGNVAVLFLDLNRFKIINDTLGHDFGDELLKVVARRLEESLRDGDTVARQGGDEFTIMLQDLATVDDVPFVLEKILTAIKQPVVLDGEELVVGISIGVSIYPDDGFDSDTLLKNADTAMYRAKADGKSGFQMYSQAMSLKANERLKMEHILNKALDDGGQFVLYYQPQFDLKTGKLIGMEALVRLNDSSQEGRLIPPCDFIPIAEETGIIIQLSEWVLKTACTQTKSWIDAGYPQITVAVNISPKVFNQEYFVQVVADVLYDTGLSPEFLEIEITEETMLTNVEDTINKMNALRDMGVRFAIDDFGIGYSSLSYLKKLPIEMLKIDKSFIDDIVSDSDDKAIVMAIIQMAQSMGLEVLAEGVETEEQLALLNSLGCNKLQGYLFSKPVPSNGFEELLEEAKYTKKLKNSA